MDVEGTDSVGRLEGNVQVETEEILMWFVKNVLGDNLVMEPPDKDVLSSRATIKGPSVTKVSLAWATANPPIGPWGGCSSSREGMPENVG